MSWVRSPLGGRLRGLRRRRAVMEFVLLAMRQRKRLVALAEASKVSRQIT